MLKKILLHVTKLCPVFLFLFNSEAQATVLHVPSQFQTIQSAINSAQNGDEVRVASGTYFEVINFLGKAIQVTSEAGPEVTIIDGSNQLVSVVTFNSEETLASVLSGFTVQNGRGSGVLAEGGGLKILNSSPKIINNIITRNGGCRGLGIYISGGAPLIQDNTITENHWSECSGGPGGGILAESSAAQIINNLLVGNFILGAGGGIAIKEGTPLIQGNQITQNRAFSGSGIAIEGFSASVSVIKNKITNNIKDLSTGGGGGGIQITSGATTQIIGNLIANNSVASGLGAGIYIFGGGASLIMNNIITGNTVDRDGGGLYLRGNLSQIVVQNLIVKNRAGQEAGGIWSSADTLINNTIADNESPHVSGVYADNLYTSKYFNNIISAVPGKIALFCGTIFEIAPPVFKNNDIFSLGGIPCQGQCSPVTESNGNIFVDPLFINPSSGDYHLQRASPCIDTGDNSAPYLPNLDIESNPRIFDGDHNGSRVVDLGVYEYGSLTFDFCIQDDSSGDTLRVNSMTGEYEITSCNSGLSIRGTGSLVRRGCTLTLQDFSSDRRVIVRIDTCQNKATASIQLLPQGLYLTIYDRNIANNNCVCPSQ